MNSERKLIPIEVQVPITWLDISWQARVRTAGGPDHGTAGPQDHGTTAQRARKMSRKYSVFSVQYAATLSRPHRSHSMRTRQRCCILDTEDGILSVSSMQQRCLVLIDPIRPIRPIC